MLLFDESIMFLVAEWYTRFAFLMSGISIAASCPTDRIVLYQVTMKTHWSREAFPRHYPEFRPPAQWSKIVGRTHNSSYHIFQLGKLASPGLKKFSETSAADLLEQFSQGSTGVFDAFNGPLIPKGVGETEAQFFADGNHSLVSLVSRIVPSPDWIVGIDSMDLCMNSEWIETITIDVDPIDAGTDSGFTYTAPNYASVPKQVVHFIHEEKLHPAHSLYYTNRKRLTPIATFTFLKMREYSLSEKDEFPQRAKSQGKNALQIQLNEISSGEDMLLRKVKKRRARRMKGSRTRDCIMSEWSEWSECSAICGQGEQHRRRHITNHPRGDGSPCSPLIETRLCSSFRDCRQNYFDW